MPEKLGVEKSDEESLPGVYLDGEKEPWLKGMSGEKAEEVGSKLHQEIFKIKIRQKLDIVLSTSLSQDKNLIGCLTVSCVRKGSKACQLGKT